MCLLPVFTDVCAGKGTLSKELLIAMLSIWYSTAWCAMHSCAEWTPIEGEREKWEQKMERKKSDNISSHVNHLHSLKMHKVSNAESEIDVEWANVVWLCDFNAQKSYRPCPQHRRHFSFQFAFFISFSLSLDFGLLFSSPCCMFVFCSLISLFFLQCSCFVHVSYNST